jgi:hypothetical protein
MFPLIFRRNPHKFPTQRGLFSERGAERCVIAPNHNLSTFLENQ